MIPGDHTGALGFSPVESTGLREWQRLTSFGWAEKLGTLPVADTEILNLSHHCPIAVQMGKAGPSVVCILNNAYLKTPRINRDGRWVAPYPPVSLRSMPFRIRMERGEKIVEVATALVDAGGSGPTLQMRQGSGEPSKDYAHVLSMLNTLARGGARLANAARLLIAADLLVPIALDADDDAAATLFVVSGERLFQLPPLRAAALTADGCAAFDLAAASIFSRRWLVDGLIREQVVTPGPAPAMMQDHMLEHGLRDAMDQPIEFDTSALFSFDDFVGAGMTDDRT